MTVRSCTPCALRELAEVAAVILERLATEEPCPSCAVRFLRDQLTAANSVSDAFARWWVRAGRVAMRPFPGCVRCAEVFREEPIVDPAILADYADEPVDDSDEPLDAAILAQLADEPDEVRS